MFRALHSLTEDIQCYRLKDEETGDEMKGTSGRLEEGRFLECSGEYI